MSTRPSWIFYGTNLQNVQFVKNKLEKELNLDVKCWVGGLPDFRANVNQVYPGVQYYSQDEFNDLLDPSVKIDPDYFGLYDHQFYYELNSIFRRFQFNYNYEITFDEQNHCMLVAATIMHRLKAERISTLIFFEFPHSLGSYIAYRIAQFLKLKIIIRTLAPFEERVFYTSDISRGIENNVASLTESDNKLLEAIALKTSGTYEQASPSYTKAQNKRLFIVSKLRNPDVVWKQRSWKQALAAVKNNTIPKGKFIYVGLHYQPELTSFPLGGFYNNQHAMVMLLSAVIPDDWKVVVKEHPTTFAYVKKNMTLFRSSEFYRSLRKIDKVQVVDHTVDSFNLVDASTCVATLTGTLGFEAVLRGKPCLVFGDAPFLGCEGVFKVTTQPDAVKAFAALEQKNFKVDTEQVMEYARMAVASTLHSKTNMDSDRFDEAGHLEHIKRLINA